MMEREANRSCAMVAWLMVISAALVCVSCTGPRGAPSDADFEQFLNQGNNKLLFIEFKTFLAQHGVDDAVPPSHLWRQGTDWHELKLSPFAAPPAKHWKNIVPTLKLLSSGIKPAVGEIVVVSGFRTADYNKLAGGAPRSKHLVFSAVDVLPERYVSRKSLHETLLSLWAANGKSARWGLGLYSGKRFHIDTAGYRKW